MKKLLTAVVLGLFLASCGTSLISREQLQTNYSALEKEPNYSDYAITASMEAFMNEQLSSGIMLYALGIGGDKEVPDEIRDKLIDAAKDLDYASYLSKKSDIAVSEGEFKKAVELIRQAAEATAKASKKAKEAFAWLDNYWMKKKAVEQGTF